MSQLDVFRLDGRVATVAGGSGAIGSAMASALAGAGAKSDRIFNSLTTRSFSPDSIPLMRFAT